MNTAVLEPTDAMLRPSRLVAEALVLRQDAEEVKERARQMGLSDDLTQAVVTACCKADETVTPLVGEP